HGRRAVRVAVRVASAWASRLGAGCGLRGRILVGDRAPRLRVSPLVGVALYRLSSRLRASRGRDAACRASAGEAVAAPASFVDRRVLLPPVPRWLLLGRAIPIARRDDRLR